jgi:signal transduction histidine kinase
MASHTSTSLARSTLLQMGVRIAVIIGLTTLVSYLHLLHAVREEALGQLQLHVSERAQREQAIFVLAEDNHTVLKRALAERIQAWRQQEPRARFDSLFVHLPDGTVRSRREGFDGTRMPGLFVPRGIPVDEDLRRRILASYDVLAQYGPAFHTRFTDTYITLPEGPLILYWPERPTWCLEAEPTFSIVDLDLFPGSLPQNNPLRRTTWSGIFVDTVADSWMVSASTPLDLEGRHVATLSHDILLEELMARTANAPLRGASTVLFRDDGQLISHPELRMKGATEPYNILSPPKPEQAGVARLATEERQRHLRTLFERVKNSSPGERAPTGTLELPESHEYLAMTRLQGPGWHFATVLPESVVNQPALQAARYVLLFGVGSLLLELALMAWVLKRHITRPLEAFTQAADRIASGDFQVALDTSRQDELGRLSRSFQQMAREVQKREEALRQANEGLEQRVDERTRELKDIHHQLVQTARRAGMAEIATNVLHNVGNVLNSVHTSAMVARERLDILPLDRVSRVADLLQEHQGDLATFLTRDERGQHIIPFLDKLGQHLEEERRTLLSLLHEVGRYTDHIGSIIQVQQDHARPHTLQEPVTLTDLVEDALRINSAGLSRHGVQVERHLAPLPPVLTDKHKVLMILVNLISNAKYAMDAMPEGERLLTLRLERVGEEHLHLTVQDRGIGIAPELRAHIFEYGFSTRKEGHGFGLHSSALAAQELGGSLTVHSEGPGRGASFTLVLPFHSAGPPG